MDVPTIAVHHLPIAVVNTFRKRAKQMTHNRPSISKIEVAGTVATSEKTAAEKNRLTTINTVDTAIIKLFI